MKLLNFGLSPPFTLIQLTISLLLTFILSTLGGCSSQPTRAEPALLETPISTEETSVEIEYTLHTAQRNHYRILAQDKNHSPSAKTFRDSQLLEESSVDSKLYDKFLKNALSFVQRGDVLPANPEQCKTPFKVTVKMDSKIQLTQGCRSSENGALSKNYVALSKLVKEGEFLLLYSKN